LWTTHIPNLLGFAISAYIIQNESNLLSTWQASRNNNRFPLFQVKYRPSDMIRIEDFRWCVICVRTSEAPCFIGFFVLFDDKTERFSCFRQRIYVYVFLARQSKAGCESKFLSSNRRKSHSNCVDFLSYLFPIQIWATTYCLVISISLR